MIDERRIGTAKGQFSSSISSKTTRIPLHTLSTHPHPTSCLVQVQVVSIKISQSNHRMILHRHSNTASLRQGDHRSLVITCSQQAILMADRLLTAIITHTASHPVVPIRITMIRHTTIRTRAMITTAAANLWTLI